ncbi:unnamed protein product [Knipowitschia caucasica]
MDVFEKLKIVIPNAVLVEGTSESYNEVVTFLKEFGDIYRTYVIDNPDSEFFQAKVVEFDSESAMSALRPSLPYTSVSEGGGTYHITDLSIMYTERVGKSKTKSYLAEIEKLASDQGVDYAEVLQSVMTQIGQSISELRPAAQMKQSPSTTASTVTASTSAQSPSRSTPLPQVTSQAGVNVSPNLTPQDMNPPGIQRYVVEHIVKNEEGPMHSSAQRLRPFSGPRPANEADYETWRTGVELLLNDPSVSDLHRSRKIVDSLLPPAIEMVRHLSSDTLPAVYLHTLESAYGTVQDGEELYAKFMDTFQNTGEPPSAYLQRLQVALSQAVKRGGVSGNDVNRHLLTQFCRGCWNDTLISELQLKQKKANPPSFAELWLLLRTEEDREAAKSMRMKQHLGTAKQRVSSQAHFVSTDNEEKGAVAALTTLTQQLAQQVADIQKQLSLLTAGQRNNPSASAHEQSSGRLKPIKPRAGYCFRCGEDGHIRPQCNNEPNSALVALKRKEYNKVTQGKSNFHRGRDLN